MKKLIFLLAVCIGLVISGKAQAQTDTAQMKFYYYPSANVYYDVAGNEYWIWDESTRGWKEVSALPSTITVAKAPRYVVYHSDADIWKDNALHQKKYKVKKNGTVKQKGYDGTKMKETSDGKTKTKG